MCKLTVVVETLIGGSRSGAVWSTALQGHEWFNSRRGELCPPDTCRQKMIYFHLRPYCQVENLTFSFHCNCNKESKKWLFGKNKKQNGVNEWIEALSASVLFYHLMSGLDDLFFPRNVAQVGPGVDHLFHWQFFPCSWSQPSSSAPVAMSPLITTATLHSFPFCSSASCCFFKATYISLLSSSVLFSPWVEPSSSTVSASWCVLGFDDALEWPTPPHHHHHHWILIRVLSSCFFDGCWYVFHLPEE